MLIFSSFAWETFIWPFRFLEIMIFKNLNGTVFAIYWLMDSCSFNVLTVTHILPHFVTRFGGGVWMLHIAFMSFPPCSELVPTREKSDCLIKTIQLSNKNKESYGFTNMRWSLSSILNVKVKKFIPNRNKEQWSTNSGRKMRRLKFIGGVYNNTATVHYCSKCAWVDGDV